MVPFTREHSGTEVQYVKTHQVLTHKINELLHIRPTFWM
jgi:hypothetical protein